MKTLGVTLLELLIVVAVIGVLTAIGIPMYQGYIVSSKEDIAKDNLRAISFMQRDRYSQERKYYPCPETKTNTSQIDKEFFGSRGKLTSGDYEYEIKGGCNDFRAYAFRTASASKADCFVIDSKAEIKTTSCPKPSSAVPKKAVPKKWSSLTAAEKQKTSACWDPSVADASNDNNGWVAGECVGQRNGTQEQWQQRCKRWAGASEDASETQSLLDATACK